MTAKDYLKQASTLDKIIKARESYIQDLRDKLERTRATVHIDKVKFSKRIDPMADLIAVLVDLINKNEKDVIRLLDLKEGIKKTIEALENPVHRLILFERYVNLKRWEDIAADNKYEWNYLVYRLHPMALKAVNTLINEINLLKNVKE